MLFVLVVKVFVTLYVCHDSLKLNSVSRINLVWHFLHAQFEEAVGISN